MNAIALFFRTSLFLVFIFFVFGLLDLSLFFGLGILLSLKWYWFLIIIFFLWGFIVGLFKLIIMGLSIGAAALFKPSVVISIITIILLALFNIIFLSKIVWSQPGSSFWIVIMKLIATGFVLQINYFMYLIGLSVASVSKED